MKQMFDISEKLIVGQSDDIFRRTVELVQRFATIQNFGHN